MRNDKLFGIDITRHCDDRESEHIIQKEQVRETGRARRLIENIDPTKEISFAPSNIDTAESRQVCQFVREMTINNLMR